MRIATISALVSVTLGSAFFAACTSDDSGGGNTGGKTTVGGAGGSIGGAGGAGGVGGAGGAGGSTAGGSCKGVCDSPDPQGSPECYCDTACVGNGDCCKDYTTECSGPTVTMPAGCVKPNTVTMGCNPVTNEGCTGDGVACDFAEGNKFSCFKPPNDAKLGEACDLKSGPFCIPKHMCQDKVCRQYCCADTDCTSGGSCKPMSAEIGTLGYCDSGGTDGGTDSGTDSGTDAGADAANDATADAADDGGGNDAADDATNDVSSD